MQDISSFAWVSERQALLSSINIGNGDGACKVAGAEGASWLPARMGCGGLRAHSKWGQGGSGPTERKIRVTWALLWGESRWLSLTVRMAEVAQPLAGPAWTHRSIQKMLQPNPSQTISVSWLACLEICEPTSYNTTTHKSTSLPELFWGSTVYNSFFLIFPLLSCLMLFRLRTSLKWLSFPAPFLPILADLHLKRSISRQVSFLTIRSRTNIFHS